MPISSIRSNPELTHLTGNRPPGCGTAPRTGPGTALYVGYTDGYDNVMRDPILGTRTQTTSTGRQLFVKTSYLLRFQAAGSERAALQSFPDCI